MPQQLPQFQYTQPIVERMRELSGHDGRGPLFTSDLSINEFALIRKAGFRPLGLVMGTSIYHTGFQFSGWNTSQEVTVLSQALYAARVLAMQRMEYEAAQLGADGIVGVELTVGRWEWAEHELEFMCLGTAVRADDGQTWRTRAGRPFTSALTGQDFTVLLSTGYQPVGLVFGGCVWHVAHLTLRQAWRTVGQNVEMANFTQALYEARAIAMMRMQQEAKNLGAEGVVGVVIRDGCHGWESHVVEFLSVGTAVAPRGQSQGKEVVPLMLDVGH